MELALTTAAKTKSTVLSQHVIHLVLSASTSPQMARLVLGAMPGPGCVCQAALMGHVVNWSRRWTRFVPSCRKMASTAVGIFSAKLRHVFFAAPQVLLGLLFLLMPVKFMTQPVTRVFQARKWWPSSLRSIQVVSKVVGHLPARSWLDFSLTGLLPYLLMMELLGHTGFHGASIQPK